MVKHLVFFKLKDTSEASISETLGVLNSMRGKVPQIEEMECGADFVRSPRSFDVALAVVVADREALNAYQDDPYHVDVVKKYIHAAITASAAVDYEF